MDKDRSTLFTVEGLTRRFGGLLAIDALNLRIAPGEIRALIGPNGAGKTTFLNLVTGVYRPTAGHVEFEGKRLTGLRPSAITSSGISRTFQHPALFEGLDVRDNVALAAYTRKPRNPLRDFFWIKQALRAKESTREAAMKWLDFVGLAAKATNDVNSLTPPERRLLELARAMAIEPRLLLLDEPFAGMTSEEADGLFRKVKLLRDKGVTVLLVDHNMRLVMKLADKVTVLSFGRKIGEGTPAEVRASHAVIEAYLGQENVAAIA